MSEIEYLEKRIYLLENLVELAVQQLIQTQPPYVVENLNQLHQQYIDHFNNLRAEREDKP